MRYLALLFALFAIPAQADMVFEPPGGDVVRLHETPCPDEIVAAYPPDMRGYFQAASATVDGKEFRACWALMSGGRVFLQYEDGAQGIVPTSEFREAP